MRIMTSLTAAASALVGPALPLPVQCRHPSPVPGI